MVNSLILIVCSTLFHHGLYRLWRRGLARKLFEPLVRRQTGQKNFTFTEGDVAHISELLVSFTNGVIGSICSMIVVWQARHDILYSRAPLLIPCTHWIAQYMLYDNYAMYQSALYRKDLLKYSKFTDRLILFVKKKWSMILHHALLLMFGYILVVFPEVRSEKGDFVIGMFFLRELWNPFQNFAQLLKQFSMQDTTLYFMNGISLVVVQFVIRVMNWPIVIVLFAAQYHEWSIMDTLYNLYPMCVICTSIWQGLELYWFYMIIKLVGGYTNNNKTKKIE